MISPLTMANIISMSPSTRREWIEIDSGKQSASIPLSPSTRREWIEINRKFNADHRSGVSLHTEGVD